MVHNMDRSTRILIRTILKLANSIMAITGIAVLLYSVWITVVCLRDYQKYHFPWFLWACVGIGSIFCVTALIGHSAVRAKNDCLLNFYILAMFLILLAEILVTTDVYLNDDWDKDFPKDPTHRFKDFVDFADDNEELFTFLAFFLLFSQVVSFILAMILRAMHHNHRHLDEHHHYDDHVSVGTPYALGHPQFLPQTNVLGTSLLDKDTYVPGPEKGMWSMIAGGGGAAGYPPLHP